MRKLVQAVVYTLVAVALLGIVYVCEMAHMKMQAQMVAEELKKP